MTRIVQSLFVLQAVLLTTALSYAQDTAPNTVSDVDGNTYATVKIGDQIWMAENLRTTRYADGTDLESFVMDNDEAHAATYGRLYRWNVALRVSDDAAPHPGPVQGASPEGWHIPSEDDWLTLIDYLGGEDVAGGKLKEMGFVHWKTPNAGATNETGFGALPAGWFDFTGEFKGFGSKTFLRSSTFPAGGGGYARELNNTSAAMTRAFLHPDDAIPIRCIKD